MVVLVTLARTAQVPKLIPQVFNWVKVCTHCRPFHPFWTYTVIVLARRGEALVRSHILEICDGIAFSDDKFCFTCERNTAPHITLPHGQMSLILKTRNTNSRILQGILFAVLPTGLAVLLIPQMPNPYNLYSTLLGMTVIGLSNNTQYTTNGYF